MLERIPESGAEDAAISLDDISMLVVGVGLLIMAVACRRARLFDVLGAWARGFRQTRVQDDSVIDPERPERASRIGRGRALENGNKAPLASRAVPPVDDLDLD